MKKATLKILQLKTENADMVGKVTRKMVRNMMRNMMRKMVRKNTNL